jgi:hypothetical protein
MATVRVWILILTVRITLSVCPFNCMAHTANNGITPVVIITVDLRRVRKQSFNFMNEARSQPILLQELSILFVQDFARKTAPLYKVRNVEIEGSRIKYFSIRLFLGGSMLNRGFFSSLLCPLLLRPLLRLP